LVLNNNEVVNWTLLNHNEWNIYIAATNKGLCFVGSQNESFAELVKWVNKHFPSNELIEDPIKLQSYNKELIEFLNGQRKNFTQSLDFKGTSFQLDVWNALCNIPYGETKSYSDIAHFINRPKSVRAVGTAIGANPILIAIPCHRVIGKNGSLTGYRGGLEMKINLLKMESMI